MFLLRIIAMSLQSLQANWLRTLLATIGVVIGVAAVILAMSILRGAKQDIESRFESLGADQIYIFPDVKRRGELVIGPGEPLRYEDALAIERESSDVIQAAVPQFQAARTVKYLNQNRNATVMATTAAYARLLKYDVARGRFIREADVDGSTQVAVLGSALAEELFGRVDPVDKRVRVGTVGMRVVGVMEPKGVIGNAQVDDMIFVPLTTGQRRIFGVTSLMNIVVQGRSANEDDLDAAQDEVKRILRSRRQMRAGESDDFQLLTQRQFQDQLGEIIQLFQVVLYTISGISLIVGGVGIANIMLVSVTERTREIGVRMAVGARRWDILQQFLFEASTISLAGGALGVGLGYLMAEAMQDATQIIKTTTELDSVIIALGVAVIVGLLSGLYPAWKASRLDPVEALRFE